MFENHLRAKKFILLRQYLMYICKDEFSGLAIFLFSLFQLHSSQITVITGLVMTQASADSAQQETVKTPTHESRDYNFSFLSEFHFAGLISSQASMSYLETCQASTVSGRASNQNFSPASPYI